MNLSKIRLRHVKAVEETISDHIHIRLYDVFEKSGERILEPSASQNQLFRLWTDFGK